MNAHQPSMNDQANVTVEESGRISAGDHAYAVLDALHDESLSEGKRIEYAKKAYRMLTEYSRDTPSSDKDQEIRVTRRGAGRIVNYASPRTRNINPSLEITRRPDLSRAKWRMGHKSKQDYIDRKWKSAPSMSLSGLLLDAVSCGYHPQGSVYVDPEGEERGGYAKWDEKARMIREGMLINLLADECPHREDAMELLDLARRVGQQNSPDRDAHLAGIGSALRDLALQDHARRKYSSEMESAVDTGEEIETPACDEVASEVDSVLSRYR